MVDKPVTHLHLGILFWGGGRRAAAAAHRHINMHTQDAHTVAQQSDVVEWSYHECCVCVLCVIKGCCTEADEVFDRRVCVLVCLGERMQLLQLPRERLHRHSATAFHVVVVAIAGVGDYGHGMA